MTSQVKSIDQPTNKPEDLHKCSHKFIHGGVKYQIQDWKLAGSSASPVWYFDWFFCEKCLENQYRRLDAETNTYEPILFDATAKQQ